MKPSSQSPDTSDIDAGFILETSSPIEGEFGAGEQVASPYRDVSSGSPATLDADERSAELEILKNFSEAYNEVSSGSPATLDADERSAELETLKNFSEAYHSESRPRRVGMAGATPETFWTSGLGITLLALGASAIALFLTIRGCTSTDAPIPYKQSMISDTSQAPVGVTSAVAPVVAPPPIPPVVPPPLQQEPVNCDAVRQTLREEIESRMLKLPPGQSWNDGVERSGGVALQLSRGEFDAEINTEVDQRLRATPEYQACSGLAPKTSVGSDTSDLPAPERPAAQGTRPAISDTAEARTDELQIAPEELRRLGDWLGVELDSPDAGRPGVGRSGRPANDSDHTH